MGATVHTHVRIEFEDIEGRRVERLVTLGWARVLLKDLKKTPGVGYGEFKLVNDDDLGLKERSKD